MYYFGCGDDITGSSSYRVVPFVRVLFQYPFGCRSVVELHIITSNNVGVL